MIATLGAIVLAALAAQAQPVAPDPSASADEIIRRPPITTPRMNPPSSSPADATIRNGGSTNTAGYTIVIHPDYTADVVAGGRMERKTVARPQAHWLFAKLQAALPFAPASARGSCMKSASFGSVTTIAYEGQRTPDLSCSDDPAIQELDRTVGVIVSQLGIAANPRGRLITP